MHSKFLGIVRWYSKYGTFKSLDRACVNAAIKKLYAKPANVPVAVGNQFLYSRDKQKLPMPHNHSRVAATFSYASQFQINRAIRNSLNVQGHWSNVGAEERAKIFYNVADKLEDEEKRAELVAAMVLTQAKTAMEAESDVHKIISMIRRFADGLITLSNMQLDSGTDKTKTSCLLRPLDGFVAASGPIYISWNSVSLPLTPLLMGNSVLWRPPLNYVLASFIIYKVIIHSGVPQGALQFLPADNSLFFTTVIKSDALAAINYAGRVKTLRHLWHAISLNLGHYKCFPRLVGDCDSKGYHFVHESANMKLVVDRTIEAAFSNSGQKTNSCGVLYVPSSMWPELRSELESALQNLKIGDPTDEKTFASAVIRSDIFDDVTNHLLYAKHSESAEVLVGGNFTKSLGYFIEPTIIVCKDPADRLMTEEIMGPILSVYVYKNNKLDETTEIISRTLKFGGTASIFSNDDEVTSDLVKKLRMTASNIYINEPCNGEDLSPIPLSGNRLSGTNDKIGPDFYLLRFAAPQLIEEPVTKVGNCKMCGCD